MNIILEILRHIRKKTGKLFDKNRYSNIEHNTKNMHEPNNKKAVKKLEEENKN
jgi:hypothetical protein